MQGRIDVVRPDGLIEGWCWNEDSPESRVGVTILIDGIEAGTSLAAQYREDLRVAKIGDGFHAFSFVTQTRPKRDNRTQTYILIDTESRRPVGTPLLVHNKEAISFDNRLIELETKNRLLTARLEEFAQRERQSSSPELFAVVGEFFARISKDMQRGEPLTIERRLGDIVETATKVHRPVILPVPERPALTVLVLASTSLVKTHACLTSLLRAGAATMASVVVIDSGKAQDVVLVPSLVRGIRYIRTVTDLTLECADAMQAAGSDLVMMLDGATVVCESFLSEIVDGFAHNSTAAAIGGHARTAWAELCGGGLCLAERTLKDCIRSGHPEEKADLTGSYPAHALSHQSVAFRRSALQAVGGLDPAFGDELGAAVIDLCFRLRHGGWSILGMPFASVESEPTYGVDTWVPSCLEGPSRAGDLLRARWLDSPLPNPPLFIGHAAVFGLPGCFSDELAAVRRFRELGYSVEYCGPNEITADQDIDLRRAGCLITLSAEPTAALRTSGAAVIFAAATSTGLEVMSEGCRVVIGLSALQKFQSFEGDVDVLSDTNDFTVIERARQVSGL